MEDLSYLRKVTLDRCRWLFGQEVRIVHFSVAKGEKRFYHALILPKTCSPRSLSHCDINEKILLHAEETISVYTYVGLDYALQMISNKVEERVSELLEFDSIEQRYHIDKSKIPDVHSEVDVTPVETTEAPIIPPTSSGAEERVNEGEDGRSLGLSQSEVLANFLNSLMRKENPQTPQETTDRLSLPSVEGTTQVHPIPGPDSGEPQGRIVTPLTGSERANTTGDSTEAPPQEPQRRNERTRVPEIDPYETEASISATDMTPSVSSRSDTTTTPTVERDNAMELNRQIIREEINSAIKGIFGGFAEYMKGA